MKNRSYIEVSAQNVENRKILRNTGHAHKIQGSDCKKNEKITTKSIPKRSPGKIVPYFGHTRNTMNEVYEEAIDRLSRSREVSVSDKLRRNFNSGGMEDETFSSRWDGLVKNSKRTDDDHDGDVKLDFSNI